MRHVTRIALVALFALLSGTASADPVDYSFQVTVTTGPLAGTVANGTFSFDDGIIPPGGGAVSQAGLLTDLDFTWNGTAYTEATANTGFMVFDAVGGLSSLCFGNNADAGSCTVLFGFDQWYLSPGDGGFVYSLPGIRDGFFGNVSFREVTAVPEPGTVFLILAGLLVLLMHRRPAKVG